MIFIEAKRQLSIKHNIRKQKCGNRQQEQEADMAIRNSSKALLVHNGRILVNRCVSATGEVYYDLPGGGQHDFETMEEAVVREVLEETGYHVRVVRFAALAEEINDFMRGDPGMEAYREYAHRAVHFFLAELIGEERSKPTEADFQQEESIWTPLEEADGLLFFPVQINGRISELVRNEIPQYLGCKRWAYQIWV